MRSIISLYLVCFSCSCFADYACLKKVKKYFEKYQTDPQLQKVPSYEWKNQKKKMEANCVPSIQASSLREINLICFKEGVKKFEKEKGKLKVKNSMFSKFLILENVESCRVDMVHKKIEYGLKEELLSTQLAFRVLDDFISKQPPRTLSSVKAIHSLIDLIMEKQIEIGNIPIQFSLQRGIRAKMSALEAYDPENASYFNWIPINKKEFLELENLLGTQNIVHQKMAQKFSNSILKLIKRYGDYDDKQKTKITKNYMVKQLQEVVYRVDRHKDYARYWFAPEEKNIK